MRKALWVVFSLSATLSFAQTETNTIPPKPFIEVTGTAIKEVVPDEIFISITLSDKVVKNDDYFIETQEDSLKTLLNRLNIDKHNLVLADASSAITREKRRRSEFKVTKQYTLQVKNADEVSNVFKGLYDMEIKEVTISKVDHSRMDSLRKEVRIAAIKAAKDKAEYLLAAIGEQPGKPLEIREEQVPSILNSLNYTANYQYRYRKEEVLTDAVQNTTELDFKNMEIKFSYYIKYAIK